MHKNFHNTLMEKKYMKVPFDKWDLTCCVPCKWWIDIANFTLKGPLLSTVCIKRKLGRYTKDFDPDLPLFYCWPQYVILANSISPCRSSRWCDHLNKPQGVWPLIVWSPSACLKLDWLEHWWEQVKVKTYTDSCSSEQRICVHHEGILGHSFLSVINIINNNQVVHKC